MPETNVKANKSDADMRIQASLPIWITLLAILLGCVIWAAFPSFAEMYQTWSADPRYSHGFLVPMFALFLLWHRRAKLVKEEYKSSASWWLGIPLLFIGAAMKIVGGRYFITWLDGISLLPTLMGVLTIIGGLPAFRWSWPAVGFLFFMVPLPYRIENAVGPPLQRMATIVSTYILQTFGLPAQADGNIINLEDVQIGVVEACNGLGMLMMFFAYATAVAMVIRRPLLDRILLVLSAAPIAMISNILRIALTGLLHSYATKAVADHFYHDLAGWLMMPMALAMFGSELFILSRLFVEVEPSAEDLATLEIKKTNRVELGVPLLLDVRSIPQDGEKKKRRR